MPGSYIDYRILLHTNNSKCMESDSARINKSMTTRMRGSLVESVKYENNAAGAKCTGCDPATVPHFVLCELYPQSSAEKNEVDCTSIGKPLFRVDFFLCSISRCVVNRVYLINSIKLYCFSYFRCVIRGW